MKKHIVITSIFHPTEAVKLFSQLKDYELIVVGDKKTPKDWTCPNVTFLSVENQNEVGTHLHKVLPYNHYCRKMIGYLYSIQNKASCIIDTDDDNIPKQNWTFPQFEGNFNQYREDKGFINIYQYYTKAPIWPRGLPLNLIKSKFDFETEIKSSDCKIGIWQGLADEDPDVDAIYRLTNDTPCYFDLKEPLVLGKGTITPFNTQNTIIRKELFPLMYLPTYVTFRFTDILRGLVAQPIMWLYGYRLGFTNATVIQKRNPHDYFKDFVSEIPMYKHCEEAVDITIKSISSEKTLSDNLFNAYEGLEAKGIVEAKELEVLTAWLKDLNN